MLLVLRGWSTTGSKDSKESSDARSQTDVNVNADADLTSTGTGHGSPEAKPEVPTPILPADNREDTAARDSVDALGTGIPIGVSHGKLFAGGGQGNGTNRRPQTVNSVLSSNTPNLSVAGHGVTEGLSSTSPHFNQESSKGQKIYQRIYLSSIGFFYGSNIASEEVKAHDAGTKATILNGRSQRRAKASAAAVRAVLVGEDGSGNSVGQKPMRLKVTSKSNLKWIKRQLLDNKEANRIIAQLRTLPAPPSSLDGKTKDGSVVARIQGPVHAVCLEHPDVEMASRHFSTLTSDGLVDVEKYIPSVASASIDSLIALFQDLHVVNLLSSPDFGLGQPGDGEGILAGAVPTAATVINGIEQITPQLMALGYATGKAIVPDHDGVHPPLDRMSVFTYWWGLEIAMPEQTMKYLSDAQSIQHAFINFLTALSVIDYGIREIMPFVRYISQFMDYEWNSIKAEDKGKGVVCAATWIMPAALVPRSWDFAANPRTKAPVSTTPINPAKPEKPNTTDGDIGPSNPGMLPTLVVTPATLPRSASTPDT